MAQNEKPVVPALVVLDDATLELVTGGLDKAMAKPGATSLMDFPDLQVHAPENTGSHSSNASGAASMSQELSAQAASGDMYAYMAVFQKMAQDMRNTARENRANEWNAQVSALHDAAQEIRNAAEERFKGAVVSGAMQIAGGVMGLEGASIKGMADHAALPARAGADHPVLSGITGGAPGGTGSMIQAGHELAGAGQDAQGQNWKPRPSPMEARPSRLTT
ncbi:type III secretion system translocon subunit SctB [Pseudoroseomonas wenyumeiae]